MTCILACRAVAPGMMERKRGWIVNFGSNGGLAWHASGAIYGAAKAAVHQYTRCLAASLRPYNIPVNCIAPGRHGNAALPGHAPGRPASLEHRDAGALRRTD